MIHRLLRDQADRRPDAPAIGAPGRHAMSYGRLCMQVETAARDLNRLGLGQGDRIATVLPAGPEAAVAFLATASAATAAPLNPAYRAEEFGFYLSDLRATALLVELGSESPAVGVARDLGLPVVTLAARGDDVAGSFELGGEGAPNARAAAGFSRAEDVALLLHTSGTTARPKLVPLTGSNLLASADNVLAALALTPDDRCLHVMPMFHIHGLLAGLMAPLSAGSTVICAPGFYAPRFFEWLEQCGATWYTAVPTMHQSVLAVAPRHQDTLRSHRLRFVRSSSAPLPARVLAELEATFGVPVIEAYGMTEACHQIASNLLPPRPRKAGTVGVPVGTEVAIVDADGVPLPSGTPGEIVLRGPGVMHGYESNPEANARAFVRGWFRTGDEGALDQDGFLRITGRIKEVINRGGEKIAPREVDEVLMEHPAVAQALAFAVPDDTLGEDVGAAVVLRPGATATAGDIRAFAATRLAHFKIPRTVVFLDEIPKGPTGKLQRIGLAERLGVPSSQETAAPAVIPIAPRTPVEETLAAIWADVLQIDRVGVNQAFLDLGGDSVLATLLAARVREELGVVLSMRSIFDAPTIAEQAAVVVDLLLQAAASTADEAAP